MKGTGVIKLRYKSKEVEVLLECSSEIFDKLNKSFKNDKSLTVEKFLFLKKN